MKTYPVCKTRTGLTSGFEVEMVYVSLATIVRLVSGVRGVSGMRKRRMFTRWDEIHAWFQYRNVECVVWEPFGDNGRFWIGAAKGTLDEIDLSEIEQAFRDHEPPIHRRVIGEIVTLRFLKRLLGRDDEWRRIHPTPP